jgi:hypothetical protein
MEIHSSSCVVCNKIIIVLRNDLLSCMIFTSVGIKGEMMRNKIPNGIFEKSTENLSIFASNLVYSILTTIKIEEIVNDTPDYTTMSNLMLGDPDLYRIILYTTNEISQENFFN